MCVCVFVLSHFSHVQLFVLPSTIAYQAPLLMGFFQQEYWHRLPCPSLGDLPDPGIKPTFPALQADSLLDEPLGSPSISTMREKIESPYQPRDVRKASIENDIQIHL